MERFWRWLYACCENAIKEAYLKRTGWDLNCPHCKSWASVADIEFESMNSEQSRYKCGNCYAVTAWHFDGPGVRVVPIKYFKQGEESK